MALHATVGLDESRPELLRKAAGFASLAVRKETRWI